MPEYLCKRLQQEEQARSEEEKQRESVKPLLRHISEEEREKLVTVGIGISQCCHVFLRNENGQNLSFEQLA